VKRSKSSSVENHVPIESIAHRITDAGNEVPESHGMTYGCDVLKGAAQIRKRIAGSSL
jgi:hypothetical protein